MQVEMKLKKGGNKGSEGRNKADKGRKAVALVPKKKSVGRGEKYCKKLGPAAAQPCFSLVFKQHAMS